MKIIQCTTNDKVIKIKREKNNGANHVDIYCGINNNIQKKSIFYKKYQSNNNNINRIFDLTKCIIILITLNIVILFIKNKK